MDALLARLKINNPPVTKQQVEINIRGLGDEPALLAATNTPKKLNLNSKNLQSPIILTSSPGVCLLLKMTIYTMFVIYVVAMEASKNIEKFTLHRVNPMPGEWLVDMN